MLATLVVQHLSFVGLRFQEGSGFPAYCSLPPPSPRPPAAEILKRLAVVAPVYGVRGNVDDDPHAVEDEQAGEEPGGSTARTLGGCGEAVSGPGSGDSGGEGGSLTLPSHRLLKVAGWRVLLTHIVGQPPAAGTVRHMYDDGTAYEHACVCAYVCACVYARITTAQGPKEPSHLVVVVAVRPVTAASQPANRPHGMCQGLISDPDVVLPYVHLLGAWSEGWSATS
jgi:hypothetical protein